MIAFARCRRPNCFLQPSGRLTSDWHQNLGRFLCIREELNTKIKQHETIEFSWWYTKIYGPTCEYEEALTEENKGEWMRLKNLAADLENQYRAAVGEDNHEALQEVGLAAMADDTAGEVAQGEDGTAAEGDEDDTGEERSHDLDETASEVSGGTRDATSHIVSGGNMGLRGTGLEGWRFRSLGVDMNCARAPEAGLIVSGSNMGQPHKPNARHKTIKSKAAKNSMRAIERFVLRLVPKKSKNQGFVLMRSRLALLLDRNKLAAGRWLGHLESEEYGSM